jgi:hypothetical protein
MKRISFQSCENIKNMKGKKISFHGGKKNNRVKSKSLIFFSHPNHPSVVGGRSVLGFFSLLHPPKDISPLQQQKEKEEEKIQYNRLSS